MAWVFNPFTGKLDQAGSGGSGGSQVNCDWNSTSGVSQILNKPTIPSAQVNSDWNASTGVAAILNKPSLFSGAYADLTGKPTLFSGAYSALTGTPSTFSPSAHASSHASGGSDALTLASSQITGLASVATSGAYSSLTGTPSLATVATSGSAADLTGTLADSRLSSNVALDNQNNNFTAGQTITAAANTSALTASYSVTGANTTPLLNLTGTWNTTGVAKGLLLNVTDTASAAGSLLADFQNGGVSAFTINKYGTTSGTGGFSFTPASNTGTWSFVSGSTSTVQFRMGSTVVVNYRGDSAGSVDINSTLPLSWNGDTKLYRDAAGTLALRNGTNAQTARIYGTYTDASNGRRLDITSTTGGIFTLTATGNGTGATGNLLKLTQPILLPASSVTLATNGDLAFEATSNSSLTIRYRGSDGTTRSATLTLV